MIGVHLVGFFLVQVHMTAPSHRFPSRAEIKSNHFFCVAVCISECGIHLCHKIRM
ncbi:hypothetical protein Plhal703r1_c20g0090011 [Plasmopara halstedii]